MHVFFTAATVFGMAGLAGLCLGAGAAFVHRVFFLSLLPACVHAGFLLTAMPIWTGDKNHLGTATASLATLVVAVLAAAFWPQGAAALMVVFWLALLGFCGWQLIRNQKPGHAGILWVLFLLFAAQAAYACSSDERFLQAQIHLHAAAACLIAFRISLVLGGEALKESRLKDPVFIPNPVYRNLAASCFLLYAAAELCLPPRTAGFVAIGCGLMLLAKLRELHHGELLRKHYIRIYYLAQLLGASAYLWRGTAQLPGHDSHAALHLLSVGYLAGLAWLIMVTVGLRHNGVACMDFPKRTRLAFVCLSVAAVAGSLRLGMAFAPWLLAAAAALYLLDFVPIFRANLLQQESTAH
ncbi:MAG: NnrS family protein [Brachymonas sp.]|nr:NnrS family protein [Brachymonas sp.]